MIDPERRQFLEMVGLSAGLDTRKPIQRLTFEYGKTGGSREWSIHRYVNPSGSDKNDGTSASSPKKTINAAIESAGASGRYDQQLIIHLAAGTYTDSYNVLVELRENKTPNNVHLVGERDSAGNPASVIDAKGDTYCVSIRPPVHLNVTNCRLQNAQVNLDAIGNVTVDLANTSLKDAKFMNVHMGRGAVWESDNRCRFDMRNVSDSFGNVVATGNVVSVLGGTVIGSGGKYLCRPKEQGWFYTKTGTILDGDDEPVSCIVADDQVNVKVHETTFKNAYSDINAGRSGNVKVVGKISRENILYGQLRPGAFGTIIDENGEQIGGLPTNDGIPSLPDERPGNIVHDLVTGYPRVKSGVHDAQLELGRVEVDSGTVDVPAGGCASVELPADIGAVAPSYEVVNQPDSAVLVDWGVERGGGSPAVVFTERYGDSTASVRYRIFARP